MNLLDLDKQANDLIQEKIQNLHNIPIDTPKGLDERSQKILELNTIASNWSKTLERLNSIIHIEKRKLEEELKKTEEKLIKIKRTLTDKEPKAETWADVVRDNKFNLSKKPVDMEIAPSVFIKVFRIEHIEDCHKYRGWWCWHPSSERFHISINDEIINGITTIINPAEVPPIKFLEHKECEEGKPCDIDYKTTNFYIPREFNPDSRDIRQFTNRMRFIPASKELQNSDKYAYRLGSKDTLKKDLIFLKTQDYRLFKDLTVNFLLILTVAAREMRRKV